MADSKPRVRVYVSMRTGECSIGILDGLLFLPTSPMAMNISKI